MDLMRSVSTAALAVGLTLIAGAADATTFGRFATLAIGSGTGPALSFDRFDPALGTLTGVVFSLSSSEIQTTASISMTNGEGGSASAAIRSEFRVFQVGGVSSIFSQNGSATSSCTDSNFSFTCSNPLTDSEVLPALPVSRTYTSPSDLANFIAAGPDTTFEVFVVARAIVESVTCSPDQAICTADGTTTWNGALTVAYRFDAAPESEVPAPTPLVLLGASLAALAGLRRRSA